MRTVVVDNNDLLDDDDNLILSIIASSIHFHVPKLFDDISHRS